MNTREGHSQFNPDPDSTTGGRPSMPSRIGPYEITREIGRGGMGVVYLARDTKLDRDVAIKCLPDELADDADRLARFEREAKLLASLNHPHIATIHGLEEADGKQYLILEYVEGETLAERLDRGAIPVTEALAIAKQIAEGIEAAHEKGVIHRDLKPANIKFTSDEQVKVLDFGLAKSVETKSLTDTEIANSPTIVAPGSPTMPGVVLGTAGYLSPEQARGRPVDKRADIFAFGCVLFEMLTGEILFAGETVSDSFASTLKTEPAWDNLPPDTPPTIHLLLRRCLAKDRKRRLQDIGDARVEIEEAALNPELSSLIFASASPGSARPVKKSPFASTQFWIFAIIFGGLGVLVGRALLPKTAPAPVIHAQISPPPGANFVSMGDLAGPVVVSPDGRTLAFVARVGTARQQLWIRRLDSVIAEPLPGTGGAFFPFWSPDSRSLGYFAGQEMKRIDIDTGFTLTICEAEFGRGGAWMEDDSIVFSPVFQESIYRVPASGGEPTPLTQIDETRHESHRWPAALPDGKHFLFTAIGLDHGLGAKGEILLGSVDGTTPRVVMSNTFNVQYAAGHLLYQHEGNLLAVPFDTSAAMISGDPVVLTQDLAYDPSTWYASFSVSEGGTLAYLSAADQDKVSLGTMVAGLVEANATVAYDRTGTVIRPPFAERIAQFSHALSPEDDALAMSLATELRQGYDIWIYDLKGDADSQSRDRQTFLRGNEMRPVWSPDGTELIFGYFPNENVTAKGGVYRKRIGAGAEKLIVPNPEGVEIWPDDWSKDGRYISLTTRHVSDSLGVDILIHVLADGTTVPFHATDARALNGMFSPNGKWLAYMSNESGQYEVYVSPLVIPSASDGDSGVAPAERWQVSTNGGWTPRWRGDGKELYYCASNSMLMAVTVNPDADVFQIGETTPLFQTSLDAGMTYEVSNDGTVFYVGEYLPSDDQPLTLIINWTSKLKDQ